MSSRYDLSLLSVLVVDDNGHMRALVKSILHALGVKEVRDVSDAVDAFRELQYFAADVIIVDWNMEPIDGIEFTRLVRTAKDSPNPFVPIIMLSGHTELFRVSQARDSGINEYLAKPISAKSLYGRILSIIGNPRPFIRSNHYFGPDRRRRDDGPPNGIERRQPAMEPFAGRPGLTDQEIEALLAQETDEWSNR